MAFYNNAPQEVKDFTNCRFMFCLSVMDKESSESQEFIVCQRYFNARNFIEGSMQTLAFKEVMDQIKAEIQDELKMETNIWSSYNYTGSQPMSFGRSFKNYDEVVWTINDQDCVLKIGKPNPDDDWYDTNKILDEELIQPLAEDWRYTFKFAIYDREKDGGKREVISTIFDGKYFPSSIRDNVDLTMTNKNVDTNGLRDENYIKGIIANSKKDLVFSILNKVYSVCSFKVKDGNYDQENKRVREMINERYLDKSTGAKSIYFNKRDEFLALKGEKEAKKTNTNKA